LCWRWLPAFLQNKRTQSVFTEILRKYNPEKANELVAELTSNAASNVAKQTLLYRYNRAAHDEFVSQPEFYYRKLTKSEKMSFIGAFLQQAIVVHDPENNDTSCSTRSQIISHGGVTDENFCATQGTSHDDFTTGYKTMFHTPYICTSGTTTGDGGIPGSGVPTYYSSTQTSVASTSTNVTSPDSLLGMNSPDSGSKNLLATSVWRNVEQLDGTPRPGKASVSRKEGSPHAITNNLLEKVKSLEKKLEKAKIETKSNEEQIKELHKVNHNLEGKIELLQLDDVRNMAEAQSENDKVKHILVRMGLWKKVQDEMNKPTTIDADEWRDPSLWDVPCGDAAAKKDYEDVVRDENVLHTYDDDVFNLFPSRM
jgi:hypothetical protein